MRTNDELAKIVAANVKRLRAERGLTLDEVVAALQERGVHLVPSTLHRLENGARHLRFEEAPQVAAVLGVDMEALLAPPVDGVPEEVTAAVAEVVELSAAQAAKVAHADQLRAQLMELTSASGVAEHEAGKAIGRTKLAAQLLLELQRTYPGVAAHVVAALTGRVPLATVQESVPESAWALIEAAEDDQGAAPARRSRKATNKSSKGRKSK